MGTKPPWAKPAVGYLARLGLMTAVILLIISMIISFLITFGLSRSLVLGELGGSMLSNLIGITIAALVGLASLGGLIVVAPRVGAAPTFKTSYGQLPPTELGHPFEVRYQRYLWGARCGAKARRSLAQRG
jgi:hypothetical protein